MRTYFWTENLKVRDHSKDLDACGRMILKWILEEKIGKERSGFIWPRIGSVDGLL
jgi:hypothetical protein